MSYPDKDGTLLSHERMRLIGKAMSALRDLTEWERGYVLCWFCSTCQNYVGPGETCTHQEGETRVCSS